MSISSDVDRHYNYQSRGFLTPQPSWKARRCSPVMPSSERKPRISPQAKTDLFHVMHKVPSGDSPYVRAKHVQLIDKDPGKAVSLFWAAINTGDRVDSALKDMATVMMQLDRPDEAIEAIKSFRHLCPPDSQDSLDNILLDLYKLSGRFEEEITMLQLKVKQVEEGICSGRKMIKTARCHGRKVQISVEKEYSRLLGNLAWAYMQKEDFKSAEENYRKALTFETDKNKQCNLAMCLMQQKKLTEAKFLLQTIRPSSDNDESYAKSYERASEMLVELLGTESVVKPMKVAERCSGSMMSEFCSDQKKRSNCLVSPPPPPVPLFINNLNKRAFAERPYGKRADFDWKKNHYQSDNSNPTHKRCPSNYSPHCNASPGSNTETLKAPFTQPRQYSKSFREGDSCRKLSFVLPVTGDNQNAQNMKISSLFDSEDWRKDCPEKLNISDRRRKPGELTEKDIPISNMAEEKKICVNLASNRKKSWADEVEEYDELLESENWQKDFVNNSSSGEFSSVCSGIDNDENVDVNITCETPLHVEKLRELESGYLTQPEKAAAVLMNDQSVKRSLCFENRNSDNCLSPLPTKVLKFEGRKSSFLSLSDDPILKRKNRSHISICV